MAKVKGLYVFSFGDTVKSIMEESSEKTRRSSVIDYTAKSIMYHIENLNNRHCTAVPIFTCNAFP